MEEYLNKMKEATKIVDGMITSGEQFKIFLTVPQEYRKEVMDKYADWLRSL